MGKPADYKLRLYVAGDSANSRQALDNLKIFCAEHLAGRHELEIVDMIREPKRALADGIFLTPTLVKLSPGPVRKIVGTLNQPAVLRQALGVNVI